MSTKDKGTTNCTVPELVSGSFLAALLLSIVGLGAVRAADKSGSPLDNLPPHIRQLTHFGQRADWSHDGKRILFIEKTFGDVYEVEVATGIIRPVTHHYFHEGYTRALYLTNGDILLSGSRTFDAEDPWPSRGATAELWVLDKSLKKKPVPLGTFCSEGPAVSRTKMRIAWTIDHENYPDKLPEHVSQIWVGDIRYEDGVPRLVNRKMVLDTRRIPFYCDLETQNFRPPDEKEIIFSCYGYHGGEVMGLDLETGRVRNYSRGLMSYEEPEGIFPDGMYTTVERVPDAPDAFEGQPKLDIWKLKLDRRLGPRERPTWQRLTYFSEYPGWRATNPVVSDDGRYMAFQLARADEAAGMGHGIFIYDFGKAPKGQQ